MMERLKLWLLYSLTGNSGSGNAYPSDRMPTGRGNAGYPNTGDGFMTIPDGVENDGLLFT